MNIDNFINDSFEKKYCTNIKMNMNKFVKDLIKEYNEYLKKYGDYFDESVRTEKTAKTEDCPSNNQSTCDVKPQSEQNKPVHHSGYHKAVDDKNHTDHEQPDSDVFSRSYKYNSGNSYNIEYDYTNLKVTTLEDAIKILRNNFDNWTFVMRCNENPYLYAWYEFGKFKVHGSWDSKKDSIRVDLYPTNRVSDLPYIGYWNELKQDIDFEDGTRPFSENKENTTVVNDEIADDNVNTTDTVTYSDYSDTDVTEDTVPEYTSTSTVDTNDQEVFTSHITADSLYNKINRKDIDGKYDIHILKAVERILENEEYRISGTQTTIWFSKLQIIENLSEDALKIFANYASLDDIVSNDHLSEIISDAFKFPMVSVDTNAVWCDLC